MLCVVYVCDDRNIHAHAHTHTYTHVHTGRKREEERWEKVEREGERKVKSDWRKT